MSVTVLERQGLFETLKISTTRQIFQVSLYPNNKIGTINSANSTLSTPIGNNNHPIGMFQTSSSNNNVNTKNNDSKTIKQNKETFNNIYKVRHLLEEIGAFIQEINGDSLGVDLNQYTESTRTCQQIVDDLIENSENINNNADQQSGSTVFNENIQSRMNLLLERVHKAKQENAGLINDANELFVDS